MQFLFLFRIIFTLCVHRFLRVHRTEHRLSAARTSIILMAEPVRNYANEIDMCTLVGPSLWQLESTVDYVLLGACNARVGVYSILLLYTTI